MNGTTERQALLSCMNTLSCTGSMTRSSDRRATTPMGAFAGATTRCGDDPPPDTTRSLDMRELAWQF